MKAHTLVFVNHFLLGSTRACGTSLDWYWAAFVMIPSGFLSGPLSLRMFRVLTFFAELSKKGMVSCALSRIVHDLWLTDRSSRP